MTPKEEENMKRFLSALLVLAMIAGIASVLAIGSSAEETRTITLDGKLDDWAGLHSIYVETADERNVTFYAYKAPEGIYFAADAYHGVYINNGDAWHTSTNFEVFVKYREANTGGRQYYVSAQGKPTMTDPTGCTITTGDRAVDTGVMVTEELDNGAVKYHTISEMFIANEHLPTAVHDTTWISAGMAWKTVGDNAHIFNRTSDNWWYFRDATPNAPNRLVFNETGLYYITEIEGVQQAGDFSGQWTVNGNVYTNTTRATGSANPNSFATYVLGTETIVDFTTKVNLSDGKEYAIMLGMADVNDDKILDETRDAYYLIDLKLGDNGRIGIEKNTASWGGWAKETDDGAMPKDRDVEVRVTMESNNIKVYVDGALTLDWTDTEYPLQGTGYGFGIKPNDGAVFTLVSDNSTTPQPDPDPTETGEPTNTQTGDLAAIVIATTALVSLAGVAVVASRRKIED